MDKLFEVLVAQEKLLHLPNTRSNASVLGTLLHDEFFEFCRSGVTTNKVNTVDALLSVSSALPILSENYSCHLIDNKTVLMTYTSYQIRDEIRIKLTHRSSLWVETRLSQWQLRFHQGTPIGETIE